MLGHGRAQVDYQAIATQQVSIFLLQHGAATGRDEDTPASGQLLQHPGFPLAEALLAFDVEYQADAGAGLGFQFMVTVENSRPSIFATRWPMVVLPEPIGPIRYTLQAGLATA